MYKHMRFVLLGVATLVSIVLLIGCQGESVGDNGGGAGGESSLSTDGVLVGRVISVESGPVANASVRLSDGRSITTDNNGFYSFSDLAPGEVVVARDRDRTRPKATPGYAP